MLYRLSNIVDKDVVNKQRTNLSSVCRVFFGSDCSLWPS